MFIVFFKHYSLFDKYLSKTFEIPRVTLQEKRKIPIDFLVDE